MAKKSYPRQPVTDINQENLKALLDAILYLEMHSFLIGVPSVTAGLRITEHLVELTRLEALLPENSNPEHSIEKVCAELKSELIKAGWPE